LIYFRRDLIEMARACLGPVRDGEARQHRKLAIYLGIASIPALLAGFAARGLVELFLRDVRVIAWSTIAFGLLLWLADAVGSRRRKLEETTLKDALIIGLSQALALIPGVSRSGVTITAGRFLGLSPEAAARFSFLLAIPIIAAAGGYGALRVAMGDAPIDWPQFGLALGLAAIAGWVCVAAFLALLKRVGLLPFVVYRLLLGVVLVWMLN